MRGFSFRETMAGSFRTVEEPDVERPISFTISARAGSFRRFLRSMEVEIEGEVDAEGLADHRHLRGTLGLDVVRTGKLPYAFDFEGNDGEAYRFVGEKDVDVRDLSTTMTTLPGEIRDASGGVVANALLRFDMRNDLVKFIRSWRLGRG